MSGDQNLASDIRRPIVAHTFDDTSGARGLVAFQRRVAIIGTQTSAGTATVETPTEVTTEQEAEDAAGKGSILALMLKTAIRVGRRLRNAPKVYIVPVADPGGTASAYTFTVTGTATAAGDIIIKIAGRTIRVPVASGDVQNDIAAEMESQIDAVDKDLPGTAGSATNVVTFTVGVTGVNGEDVVCEVIESVAGVTVVAASSVTGVGTIDTTNALDSLGSDNYFSVCSENHTAAEVTDLLANADDMWADTKKRFRHYFIGETGALATATSLASGGNRKELCIASMFDSRSLPGEIAAAVGTMRLTKERPSYNWDGTVLSEIFLPDDANIYNSAEVETALAGGVTPLTKNDEGNAVLERLVTTKTTDSGAPFENLLDLANSWTPAFYALQLDPRLQRAKQGENQDAELLTRYGDIAISLAREFEALGDFHLVEENLENFRAISHPSVPTRALLETITPVVPNAHQIDVTHRLIIEGA